MTDNDLALWPNRQDVRIAELECKLMRLEMARQRLIKMINQTRPDSPIKAGLVQAYALWSEAGE